MPVNNMKIDTILLYNTNILELLLKSKYYGVDY